MCLECMRGFPILLFYSYSILHSTNESRTKMSDIKFASYSFIKEFFFLAIKEAYEAYYLSWIEKNVQYIYRMTLKPFMKINWVVDFHNLNTLNICFDKRKLNLNEIFVFKMPYKPTPFIIFFSIFRSKHCFDRK